MARFLLPSLDYDRPAIMRAAWAQTRAAMAYLASQRPERRRVTIPPRDPITVEAPTKPKRQRAASKATAPAATRKSPAPRRKAVVL